MKLSKGPTLVFSEKVFLAINGGTKNLRSCLPSFRAVKDYSDDVDMRFYKVSARE